MNRIKQEAGCFYRNRRQLFFFLVINVFAFVLCKNLLVGLLLRTVINDGFAVARSGSARCVFVIMTVASCCRAGTVIAAIAVRYSLQGRKSIVNDGGCSKYADNKNNKERL